MFLWWVHFYNVTRKYINTLIRDSKHKCTSTSMYVCHHENQGDSWSKCFGGLDIFHRPDHENVENEMAIGVFQHLNSENTSDFTIDS